MSEIINQRDWYLKLYKFYLQLILKICVVFFSGSSVLVAYLLSHPQHPWLKHTLIAPSVIGLALAFVFFKSVRLAINMESAVEFYTEQLGLKEHWPTTLVLQYVLWVFGFMFSVFAVATIVLYVVSICRGIQ
jgi:hypothetical protein